MLRQTFCKAGHQVQIYTSDFRHIEKTYRQEKIPGYLFFSAKPYRRNLSPSRMYSHTKLSRDIFSYTARMLEKSEDDEQVLWVFVPPNSFVKDAAKVKRMYPKVRIIFDLIDLWPETIPYRWLKNSLFSQIWKELRNRHLYCADGVVVECSLYKHALGSVLKGKMVRTLYLARPKLPYKRTSWASSDALSLCFLGSMNHMTDCEAVADIIRKCKKQMPVILHLIGSGEKKDKLLVMAKAAGARVVDHGMIFDRAIKQRIFHQCDYGLNVMKPSVCVGLTMKSIDYLEAGLPLINTIPGDTWKAVEKYGIGINYDAKAKTIKLPDSKEAGRKARRFFERNLTEDVFGRRALEILLVTVHTRD